MEENNSIVTLIDGDTGEEVVFDLIATFDYEGKRYAGMMPISPMDNIGEDEVVIMEIVPTGDEEIFQPIENDILLEEVFNEFLEIFDDLADGDDEEE